MAAIVEKFGTETYGGTIGEVTAYAEKGSYSIAFRVNGHKKLVYQFNSLADLSSAMVILRKGAISEARGK